MMGIHLEQWLELPVLVRCRYLTTGPSEVSFGLTCFAYVSSNMLRRNKFAAGDTVTGGDTVQELKLASMLKGQ